MPWKLPLVSVFLPFFLSVEIFCGNSNVYVNARINLTVFYQSRCNDSAVFFEEQLKPTYHELLSRKIDVHLELIPYGRANSTKIKGDYVFSCEHGEEECEANKFHACVINNSMYDAIRLNLVVCMLDRFHMDTPKEHVQGCVKNFGYGFSYDGLKECATGGEGAQLLYNNGRETNRWNPFFMPTVLVNGEAGDDPFQEKLKTNLLGTLLKYLSDQYLAEISAKSKNSSTTTNVTQGAHLYKYEPGKAIVSCVCPILLTTFVSLSLSNLHFD